MPWLLLTAVGAVGAFIGSQIDDAIDKPALDTHSQSVDPLKVATYAIAGVAIVWAVKKFNLAKGW